MAEITRKLQKIFAGGLGSPSGNVAKYGSKLAGTPGYSFDLDEIQTNAWLQGLIGAMYSDKSPYYQDLNAIFYVITTQLAYLFQNGIPAWNSQTEYYANISYVSYNGEIYLAISNSVNQVPTDTTYWVCVSNIPSVTKAYSASVSLENNKINTITLSGNVVFSLPTPSKTTILNQIEVQLYKPNANYTVDLGTNKYLTNAQPNLSRAGYYNLYYEYDNNNSSWYVGFMYKGE